MNTWEHLTNRAKNWKPESFGRLAVLMGGTSAEREVSLLSGQAVLDACQQLGLDAHPLQLGQDPLRQITEFSPDWAFNLIHGGYGENGLLACALELLGILSPASSGRSMTLAMHKHRAKALWRQAGLATPESCLLDARKMKSTLGTAELEPLLQLARQHIQAAGLYVPLVVKPACEGSSVGLYLTHNTKQLDDALISTLLQFDEILVEALIVGTEITMTVIDNTTLPVIEIQPDKGVYDYYAKYQSDNTHMHIPTSLGKELELRAGRLALDAFAALGCRVWGRVDAMVDNNGNIYLLEVNTIPGMTSHSLVPCAAASVGIDFAQLIQVLLCIARDG